MLWIRLVLNHAYLYPAFYLNADPDPGSQKTNADPDPYPDPDPGQTLKSQKVKFLRGKYTVLLVGISSNTYRYLRRYKGLFVRQETRFVC